MKEEQVRARDVGRSSRGAHTGKVSSPSDSQRTYNLSFFSPGRGPIRGKIAIEFSHCFVCSCYVSTGRGGRGGPVHGGRGRGRGS